MKRSLVIAWSVFVQRWRVPGTAAVAVVLVVVSTLVLDWFVIDMPGIGTLGLDLRSAHGCPEPGVCASVSLSKLGGAYPTTATITFFAALGFGVALVAAIGRGMLTGDFSPSMWTKGVYGLGGIALGFAFLSAYLFAPSMSGLEEMAFADLITIQRTWAPLLLMLSVVVGYVALYFTRADNSALAIHDPPALSPVANPVVREPAPAASGPVAEAPASAALRGKLRFAAAIAELARAGIDARREDGSSVLVMWPDIVGVVARRLPSELDGVTFVDVVSAKGKTLRLLPWTRVSLDDGRALDDQTDARRALALVALVVERCPGITLDPATRTFVETRGEAAQLPDRDSLAAHDERLA